MVSHASSPLNFLRFPSSAKSRSIQITLTMEILLLNAHLVVHCYGPLLPADGKPAKFAQLYIFDTENEIQNRIGVVSNGESSSFRNNELDYQLTTDIRDLLDEINPLRDGRQYNLPTTSEVAALIVRDFDSTEHKRDIILYCQDGDFKRINELHPSYLALHYPLFFPYGEDNYRSDIFHEGITDYDEKNKGTRVTMK
ncbi:hypothetical protein Tco_1399503 [Tanacetum coccineum]